jgi:hypothetical protein
MDRIHVFGWELAVDVAATRVASGQLRAPDPACCNNCAVFLEAAARGLIPLVVAESLERIGIDARHPDEVWGAADGGILLGWWSFVGALPRGTIEMPLRAAATEVAPGFLIYPDPSFQRSHEAFQGKPVMSLSFEWTSAGLAELDAELFHGVYPPPPHNDAW